MRELPVETIKGRRYFRDDQLSEFRAVNNPHDRLTFTEARILMNCEKEEIHHETNTIVIIGSANGEYHNDEIKKEFSSKCLCMVRPDGSLVVQNLSEGIRPICYIGEGAEISLAKDVNDSEIEVIATTDDGQQLTLKFEEIYSMCGVPSSHTMDSFAMTILRCISDLSGKYGRVRIARLLTGSTSKSVLTMGIEELRTYGVMRGTSQTETLYLIDWLIDEGYLGYSDDETYPILELTDKGTDTISDVEGKGE